MESKSTLRSLLPAGLGFIVLAGLGLLFGAILFAWPAAMPMASFFENDLLAPAALCLAAFVFFTAARPLRLRMLLKLRQAYPASDVLPASFAPKAWATALALLCSTLSVQAITVTSIANGNWNATSTWDCGCVPSPTDDIIVAHDVTLNVNFAIDPGGSVTVNLGASLLGVTFNLDFDGINAGPAAVFTNYGTVSVARMRETGAGGVETCPLSTIDNYGTLTINANDGAGTAVFDWRANGTFTNHNDAIFNVPNGMIRSSNQVWLTCDGGNGKPIIDNYGRMNVWDMQMHAGSILINRPGKRIIVDPAGPGIYMAAWEFDNYGCIYGGEFAFDSKANNSGHNISNLHDGSKIYANISVTASTHTVNGIDDDANNANNACMYSPVNITNVGTFTGEFYLNDPDGVVPGTVGPMVVLGTDDCGGPGCAAACAITVTSATPTACASNLYNLSVVVTYTNSPGGNITVNTSNGGTVTVAATTSPQTITLTGLTANGVADIDVTAFFVATPACTDDLVDAYDAPAACPPCAPIPCGTTTVVKN